jgi:hypothetical protein
MPALVVGSLAPDLGYFSGRLHLDNVSNRFLGSVAFCLPVGIFSLVLIYDLKAFALQRLPKAYQPGLPHLRWPPLGHPIVIVVSLILGAWTHVFVDSLTHKDGWLVRQWPFLQASLASVGGTRIRVCRILWYLCSFGGLAWVFVTFRSWQQNHPLPLLSALRGPNGCRRAWWQAPPCLSNFCITSCAGPAMLLVAFMSLLLFLLTIRKPGLIKMNVPP